MVLPAIWNRPPKKISLRDVHVFFDDIVDSLGCKNGFYIMANFPRLAMGILAYGLVGIADGEDGVGLAGGAGLGRTT